MKKIIAVLCVLVLTLGMTSTAFAALGCPSCGQRNVTYRCSTTLGRADTPNWYTCTLTAGCLYDYVAYWTGVHCDECGYDDNACKTHNHLLEHKKCPPTKFKADQCPY